VIRGMIYRAIMRIAHRFHWHYAPPVYPAGDTMLWCKWCGFREVVRRGNVANATRGHHMTNAEEETVLKNEEL